MVTSTDPELSMPLKRLDHFNVVTAQPEKTLRFYCDGLGLVNDPSRRPDFGIPGAWLFIDDQPVVHLVFVDDDPRGPSGALDHVAFAASDREAICARLDKMQIAYRAIDHPSGAFSQLFLEDPNGVKVEINIRAEASNGA